MCWGTKQPVGQTCSVAASLFCYCKTAFRHGLFCRSPLDFRGAAVVSLPWQAPETMDLHELLLPALLLDKNAFLAIYEAPNGLLSALLTVLLAGVSTALGQSVTLFINQVSPRRFGFTVLVSSALYVFNYLVWALSLWGIGHGLFGSDVPLEQTVRTVGLGYAPLLFSFLAFVPFFGVGLGSLLSLWSLLAIVVGAQVGLELGLWQAALCGGLGWLMLQTVQRTVGRPLVTLSKWLRARAAGVERIREVLGTDDLVQEMLAERGLYEDASGRVV